MGQLQKIVEDFSQQPMQSGKAMRLLIEKDLAEFFEEALPLLRIAENNHGFQYLLTLLLLNDLILEPLVDPAVFSFEEAVNLAKLLMKIEPLLDIRMLRTLTDSRNADPENDFVQKIDSAKGIRLLDVMSAISDGARILPMMAQLLHHSSVWVRSKAALLVGRGNKNHKWVEQRLSEKDPRVRANAVESLWGVDSEGSKTVFWAGVTDTDNRVAGNALLGLYRLGEVSSIPLIFDLLDHSDGLFRTTGVWVMGETGDPRFRGCVAKSLSDSDSRVRTAAFRAVAKIKQNEARYRSGQDVHLRLQSFDVPGSAWLHVSAALWTGSAIQGKMEPVLGLRPTQFLIQEDRRLVTQFEIHEVSHPESISVAFALPRGLAADDPFHRQCVAGLSRALLLKRKPDSWLILKYLPKPAGKKGTQGANRGPDHSMLHLDAAQESERAATLPLPDDVRFLTDDQAIGAAAEASGARLTLPIGILETACTLIPALAQSRGARHLVLVTDTAYVGTTNDPGWAEISRAAKISKMKIHVIGLRHSEELKSLAYRTGGGYNLLSSVEEIPAAVEALYASLLHYYMIRYRSVMPESGDLSVKVYSIQGVAEDYLTQPELPQPGAPNINANEASALKRNLNLGEDFPEKRLAGSRSSLR